MRREREREGGREKGKEGGKERERERERDTARDRETKRKCHLAASRLGQGRAKFLGPEFSLKVEGAVQCLCVQIVGGCWPSLMYCWAISSERVFQCSVRGLAAWVLDCSVCVCACVCVCVCVCVHACVCVCVCVCGVRVCVCVCVVCVCVGTQS